MGSRGAWTAATVLLVAMAGCTGDSRPAATPLADDAPLTSASSQEAADAPLPDASPLPVEVFTGTGCEEGGSHSAYNMGANRSGPVAPWVYADAYERLGRPTVTSTGPYTGDGVRGNWAPVLRCQAWTREGVDASGFVWALTAAQVEPPSFDPGGADVHYLAELFAVHDDALAADLLRHGVPSIASRGEVYEWVATDTLHVQARYGQDVAYDAYLAVRSAGQREAETVRLWIITETSEGFRPVSLDLVDVGGSGRVAQGGVGAAVRTQGGSPLPGAPMPALVKEGFDRVVRLGPQPDVVLDEAWIR